MCVLKAECQLSPVPIKSDLQIINSPRSGEIFLKHFYHKINISTKISKKNGKKIWKKSGKYFFDFAKNLKNNVFEEISKSGLIGFGK